MDGGQFLLLQNLARDVADRGHERSLIGSGSRQRSNVDLVVLEVRGLQRAAAGIAGSQCGVERTEVGTHDLGVAERSIEVLAHNFLE